MGGEGKHAEQMGTSGLAAQAQRAARASRLAAVMSPRQPGMALVPPRFWALLTNVFTRHVRRQVPCAPFPMQKLLQPSALRSGINAAKRPPHAPRRFVGSSTFAVHDPAGRGSILARSSSTPPRLYMARLNAFSLLIAYGPCQAFRLRFPDRPLCAIGQRLGPVPPGGVGAADPWPAGATFEGLA